MTLIYLCQFQIWHISKVSVCFDCSISRRQYYKKNCNLSHLVILTAFNEKFLFFTLVPLFSGRSLWCFPLHSLHDLSDAQSLNVCAPKQLKHKWCFEVLSSEWNFEIAKMRASVQVFAAFVFGTKFHKISVRTSMWFMPILVSVLIGRKWNSDIKVAVYIGLVFFGVEEINFTLIKFCSRRIRPKKNSLQAWAYTRNQPKIYIQDLV